MLGFGQPLLLLTGPLAVLLLYLLERWRQQPLEVVVADLDLFQPSPEAEAEAQSRKRRVQLSWLLRAAAALLLACAAAEPSLPPGPGGAVTVDLVLDRGLRSGTREGDGTRLDRHRAQLERVLDGLRSDDRVRLHAWPGSPAGPPIAPAAARAALARSTPTGASVDLPPLVRRLAGRATLQPAPPVFVTTDRQLDLSDPLRARVEIATAGSAQPDRAILALARSGSGTAAGLHVTLGARGPGGRVAVELAARSASGAVRSVTRQVTLPADGLATAVWAVADGFPVDAREASARLRVRDALPTNDRAFAALKAAPPRVVGVVEDADPPVLRALRAVPGTELRRLPSLPTGDAAAAYDLLVVPNLPRQLPATALIAIPLELPDDQVAGGRIVGQAQPGFAYTLRVLSGEPEASAPLLGPLASDLRSSEPLLRAGPEPFLVVRGSGRRLLAAVRAPLRGATTPWVQLRSFPVFWGELLERAAPRAAGGLAAHVAGEPWEGTRPLEVRRYLSGDGRLVLGTVAAPLDPAPVAASAGFSDTALSRLDAARPRTQRPSLTPLLAFLALLLACASWIPNRSGSAPTTEEARDRSRASAGTR